MFQKQAKTQHPRVPKRRLLHLLLLCAILSVLQISKSLVASLLLQPFFLASTPPFWFHHSYAWARGSLSGSSFVGSMADHFAVMAGRLLTESSLQSAIDEASVVPSTTSTACDVSVQDGRPATASGVLVECRICQEDDDEACMEAPCSCKGSLKVERISC